MKAASINEIKQSLKNKSATELADLCLRLSRYKKENKELLTYLLFEANDLENYLNGVKEDMDNNFEDVNTNNLYFAKKSIRKILRATNKYIKYTGTKTAEAELLLYFCLKLKEKNLPLHHNAALSNLYNGQLKKAKAAIATLHEDLQYDFNTKLEELQ